jgi:PAS domain S-box-containing protein
LQTILYFVSILLTCGLTGWLAFYAWRRRSMPGVRAYAAMAFSESLLALAEMLSMTSSGPVQALFWFDVRVIFTAIIPVLWLVFALEYQGHKEWLSRRLIVFAFIVPVLTQILLWSNSLHGLWVKQETSFHQNGVFWLADTSARIPGLWFLIHSFYGLLLVLAGIVVILITAWGKQSLYKSQALLLSSGALIAIITTLIPILNLTPQAEFNPFIPGIGVSTVFYALAIFRFQFLKRTPAMETTPHLTPLDAQEKRSLAILVFIFLFLVAGISTIGYLSYKNFKAQFRTQVEGQLSSIAAMKVDELHGWRDERLSDADIYYTNPAFSALVQRYFENPSDALAQTDLQAWLDVLDTNKQYDRVSLLDAGGIERISSISAPEPVAAHLIREAAAVLRLGQVTFLDFHRDTADSLIHLALLVPIFSEQDNHPLGVVVLRINPSVYLYPFIQQWPVPSASAETLLVRRDGENVLYLNALRFQPDSALNLRIPLANTENLAVKAVLGQTGTVDGIDYRGVAVIGDVRSVSGSPWFLESRMDIAEVYAPLRERLWQIVTFLGVLIAISWAGLALVWRRQQVRFYQASHESAGALRESEEKFRKAFLISPDALAISRLFDGRFVAVNQGFTNILGYSDTDVIGKSSLELNIWSSPEDRKKIVTELQATGMVENLEAYFRTKTGDLRNGLISASIVDLNGVPHILNATRDITDRKQAEAEQRKITERLSLACQAGGIGIWELDVVNNNLIWDDQMFCLYGITSDMFSGTYEAWRAGVHPDDLQKSEEELQMAMRGENGFDTEFRVVWPDGTIHNLRVLANVQKNASGQVINLIGTNYDITERKQVEEALHRRSEYLAALQETTLELLSQLELNILLENIVRRAGLLIGTSSGFLDLVEQETGQLKPLVGLGGLAESLQHPVERGEGVAGTVWQTGEPLVVNDYENWPGRISGYSRGILSSIIGIPLLSNGQVLGVLGLGFEFAAQRAFEQVDVEILIQFARLATIAIENARLFSVAQQELIERKQAEDALRQLSERQQALLSAIPDIIMEVECNKVYTWANQAGIEFFGEDVIGREAAFYFVGDQDTYRVVEPLFNGSENMIYVESLQRRKDGENRLLAWWCQVLKDDLGNITGMLSSARDITEHKQQEEQILATQVELQQLLKKADLSRRALLSVVEDQKMAEEEIRRLNAELEQRVANRTAQLVVSNKELEAFAYSVSHDLRAPLRAIDGFSRILQQEYAQKLDDEGLRLLGVVRDNTSKMDHLITDLLALSRVGRSELKYSSIDMTAMVKSIYHELATPEV